MKKITFPFEVKRGSVSVKIYRTPSNGCNSYTLAYYQDGVRKRPTFPSFQAANDDAEGQPSRGSTTRSGIHSSATAWRTSKTWRKWRWKQATVRK
jgi:hypothetical protein